MKDLTSHLADREQEMIGLREVPGVCSVRVASCLVELWLTSPPPPPPSLFLHTQTVSSLTCQLETSKYRSEQLTLQLNQVKTQVQEGNFKIANFDNLVRWVGLYHYEIDKILSLLFPSPHSLPLPPPSPSPLPPLPPPHSSPPPPSHHQESEIF